MFELVFNGCCAYSKLQTCKVEFHIILAKDKIHFESLLFVIKFSVNNYLPVAHDNFI